MITQQVDINHMPFGFMIGHGIADAITTLTQKNTFGKNTCSQRGICLSLL